MNRKEGDFNKSNDAEFRKNTKKNKIAFYIAIVTGLIFVALAMIVWGVTVQNVAEQRSVESEFIEEQQWRKEYVEKIQAYNAIETNYREDMDNQGFRNIDEADSAKQEEFFSYVRIVEQSFVEKRGFFRSNEAPIYFGTFQAKNLNGTNLMIESLNDYVEAIKSGNRGQIKTAKANIYNASAMLDESIISFDSARTLSEERLQQRKRELGLD